MALPNFDTISIGDLKNVHNLELLAKSVANSSFQHHVTAIQNFKQNDYIDDPLYLGYRPFFHYTDVYGLLAPETLENSALAYLKRIGEDTRYESLKQFIRMMKKINTKMTYMFQTIDGLVEAKNNLRTPVLHEDNVIVLGMLETLDMRVQGLIQLYQSIVYDSIRHVWVLPRNLRQFSISIIVYPIGVYRVATELEAQAIPNAMTSLSGGEKPADALKFFNHVMFEFSQCEIDLEGSGTGFYDMVSNSEITEAMQTFAFTYKRVRQSGVFKTLLGNTTVSSKEFEIAQAVKKSNVGSRIIDFIGDAAAPVVRDLDELRKRYGSLEAFKSNIGKMGMSAGNWLAANARNIVANQINRLYLGNVYETSPQDIAALALSRSFENLLINAGRAFNNDTERGTTGTGTIPPTNIYNQNAAPIPPEL